MAKFDPPFAGSGERRPPASDEQQLGFGCGAADLFLFNWMFWAIQSELGEVIKHAGLEPDNGDMTQVRQAIQMMIDASTGGGETDSYLTLLQASARLPIFPEVQNTAGHFGVVSPGAGQVRVPAGVTFLHRGISPYTTVEKDLATDASKTYHLRWNKTDGFQLKDTTPGGAYNPSSLLESNSAFDSTYDDMLVARVITNSSNVPTITNLKNAAVIRLKADVMGTPNLSSFPSGVNGSQFDFTVAVNCARTPDYIWSTRELYTDGPSLVDLDIAWNPLTETRYQWGGTITHDSASNLKFRLLGIA